MDDQFTIYIEKMHKTHDNLMGELATIRAGRANPHVLDRITVDYYGTQTPLQQVGNISVPEARIIQIQPWDKSVMKEIEKAINMSDLGINPTNDGQVIRLVFPELTEERRKELTKDVKKKGEAAKVAIRNIRRDAMDLAKKLEKNAEITEDDLARQTKDIQELTDHMIEKIDQSVEAKNKDNSERFPKHIAIILDGNGRWAASRGLPRALGHKKGCETLEQIVEDSARLGISYLTVYGFSTENWKRSEEEVWALMMLFRL